MEFKIKSITDVITNSSSEVFVVKDAYDGDELIDWNWINNGGKWETEMICDICHIPYPGFLLKEEEVDIFIEKYKDVIQKELIDKEYWWADIEDYYDEDWNYHSGSEDLTHIVWSDYRH